MQDSVSCLNVYLPSYKDTLQAPKICAVVRASLLHRMHMTLVIILYLSKLTGDGSVSYVEDGQNQVRLARFAIKEAQEKSC